MLSCSAPKQSKFWLLLTDSPLCCQCNRELSCGVHLSACASKEPSSCAAAPCFLPGLLNNTHHLTAVLQMVKKNTAKALIFTQAISSWLLLAPRHRWLRLAYAWAFCGWTGRIGGPMLSLRGAAAGLPRDTTCEWSTYMPESRAHCRPHVHWQFEVQAGQRC